MERKRGGELTELSWQKELRAQTGKRCMGRMMLGPRKRMRIFIHVTVVTLLVDCMHLLKERSSNYPTHKKETLSGNLCVHNWSPASKFQLSKQPASKTENIRPWKNCPWPCAGSFSLLALLVRRRSDGNQFPDYIIFCRVLWMETFVQLTIVETHYRYGAPYTLCKHKWAKLQI